MDLIVINTGAGYHLVIDIKLNKFMVEIISIHVPKTAGTTFKNILFQVYGTEGVCVDNQPGYPEVGTKARVIHGHFPTIKYEGKYPSAKRIIWLRNPVERLISQYFYWKGLPLGENPFNDPHHTLVVEQNLSILEFAEMPEMRNLMYKATSEKPITNFYFIGIKEYFKEDLQRLKEKLNWPDFPVTSRQTNQYPNYQEKLQKILSDQKTLDKLASLNPLDIELYQQALRLRK
ncbi:MAG: sulfotransferase family protein [Trichodesmium sp. MAG_R03]|nr:sulfotransferase family protein [Trichodesmium sp. MAG_R03]